LIIVPEIMSNYSEAAPSAEISASENNSLEMETWLTELYTKRFKLLHPISYKATYDDGVFLAFVRQCGGDFTAIIIESQLYG